MRLSGIIAALSLGVSQAAAFGVFAHFMVGNTLNYTANDWKVDSVAAKLAGIDAFALLPYLPAGTSHEMEKANEQLQSAFDVAVAQRFQLFFSFDYAGLGAWEKEKVIAIINRFKDSPAHYKHNNKPLVSTFEGPEKAADWPAIKAATGCFFVPDWSSLGAKNAISAGTNSIDGLFSWAAWPWGDTDMNTHGDASYMQFLQQGGKPTYMMPVSPGFYTNLPTWHKNWMWRGDDLWFDRWLQVVYLTRIQKDFAPPTFAQIISWNDYGESHYIGPLIPKATYAFEVGKAFTRYADGVHHDGFRRFLPFLIQLAKTGSATIGTQGVTMWYRNSEALACTYSGTVANTATQLQREFSPPAVVADKVFYSALLGAPATVTVTVGGVSLNAAWTDTPPGGVGMYHGSASFRGRSGQVVVTVNGVATVTGNVPIGACVQQNFNPYVFSASGPNSGSVLNINGHVCVAGFGLGAFANICKFSCALGYCPVTACTCSRIGPQPTRPTALQKDGFPTNGDRIFEGLCSFAINYGYQGSECSSTRPASWFTPALSPFFPDTATSGIGNRAVYDSMCIFSCKHGWCPINLCTPKSYGPLVPLPGGNFQAGTLRSTLTTTEILLCRFIRDYGFANKDFCFQPPPPTTTSKPAVLPTIPPTSTAAPPPPPPATPTYTWHVYMGFYKSSVDESTFGENRLYLAENSDVQCRTGLLSAYPLRVSNYLLNLNDDASKDGRWACDKCWNEQHAGTWDLKRVEMRDSPSQGVTKQRVGQITAYRQPDGVTYELVSVAKVGDPFTPRGSCVRAPVDAHMFECKNLAEKSTARHVLTCTPTTLEPELAPDP